MSFGLISVDPIKEIKVFLTVRVKRITEVKNITSTIENIPIARASWKVSRKINGLAERLPAARSNRSPLNFLCTDLIMFCLQLRFQLIDLLQVMDSFLWFFLDNWFSFCFSKDALDVTLNFSWIVDQVFFGFRFFFGFVWMLDNFFWFFRIMDKQLLLDGGLVLPGCWIFWFFSRIEY